MSKRTNVAAVVVLAPQTEIDNGKHKIYGFLGVFIDSTKSTFSTGNNSMIIDFILLSVFSDKKVI